MLVSIIICTCSRSQHLRKTLESLGAVALPPGIAAEVIVVDNASTDDTRDVVCAWNPPQFTVRYVLEPRQGQAFARNTGMARSRGEILLHTDDDVRLPPDWIEQICRPIARQIAPAATGGIHAAPHLVRPWMTSLHCGWLALSHVSAGPVEHLVGANMAFSRDVLEKVPAFDTELGPGQLGFYDDTLFSRQLRKAGFTLRGVPAASLEHHFDESRLSRSSFLQTARKHGRCLAYMAYHWEHSADRPSARDVWEALARLMLHRARRASECAVQQGIPEWEACEIQGLYYRIRLRKERQRPHQYEPFGLVKRAGG